MVNVPMAPFEFKHGGVFYTVRPINEDLVAISVEDGDSLYRLHIPRWGVMSDKALLRSLHQVMRDRETTKK